MNLKHRLKLLIYGAALIALSILSIAVSPDTEEENQLNETQFELWDRSDKMLKVLADKIIFEDRVLSYSPHPDDLLPPIIDRVNLFDRFLNDINLRLVVIPSSAVLDPYTFHFGEAETTSLQALSEQFRSEWIPVSEILEPHSGFKLYFASDDQWTMIASYYVTQFLLSAEGKTISPLTNYELHNENTIRGTYRDIYEALNQETVDVYLSYPYNALQIVTRLNIGEADLTYESLVYAKSRNGFDALVEGYYRYSKIDGWGDGSIFIVGDNNVKFMVTWLLDQYDTIYISNAAYDDRTSSEIKSILVNENIESVWLVGSLNSLSSRIEMNSIDNWIVGK